MDIKLICIDMDGTLLVDEHNVSEENKKAVKYALEKGVHIAITTGRVYNCAMLYSELIGLKTPIIASNGAYIGGTNGEEIYKNPLTKEEVRTVFKIATDNNLLAYLTTRYGLISLVDLPENNIYKVLNKTLPKEKQIRLEVIESIDKILELYKNEILKGVCVENSDKEKLLKAREELSKLNPELEIATSWKNNFEVTRKGSSKGEAVKRLAEYLNISSEEVMCIGDSENDISMLKYAGCAIAMGNASDDVKKVADFITEANYNSGVAKAIYKFIL